MTKKNKTILIVFASLLAIAVICFCTWCIFRHNLLRLSFKAYRLCANSSEFSYLNPEVACFYSNDEDLLYKYNDLKSSIKKYIDLKIKNKEIDSISVFMRDLVTRKWLGINENENYYPASLLKLPLAIAFYKYSETDPGIIYKKFTFSGNNEFTNEIQLIKPEQTLQVGQTYTIQEIVRRLIVYSDNNAIEPLGEVIPAEFFYKVFMDIGLTIPTESDTSFLSAKTYSNILRMLYNASYLSPENSEKLLSLLVEVKFDEGLKGGLPENIELANKFGEREINEENNKSLYLYDCGIVYHPKNPYILCVMAKGKNIKNLKETIKHISKITFDEFSDLDLIP